MIAPALRVSKRDGSLPDVAPLQSERFTAPATCQENEAEVRTQVGIIGLGVDRCLQVRQLGELEAHLARSLRPQINPGARVSCIALTPPAPRPNPPPPKPPVNDTQPLAGAGRTVMVVAVMAPVSLAGPRAVTCYG